MKHHPILLVVLGLLAFSLLACSLGAAGLSPKNDPTSLPSQAYPLSATQDGPASANTPVATQGAPANANPIPAPGDFNLADPAVGLDGLHSYRQVLQTTFEGTINGEQKKSSETLTRELANEPPTHLTWIDSGGQPVQFFGRIGEFIYRQPSPNGTCSASPDNSSGTQAAPAVYELASLPPIAGAEAAGEGEKNGVPARHYTFDERAIGYAGQARAQGDVWVASTGGYVLSYTLRVEAPDGLLGPGVAGVQTWSYVLSEVNTGKTSLPSQCQKLLEKPVVPMLDGASVILQQPGYLKYQVSSNVEAATAFYQQQAETLGWSAGTPFLFGNVTRITMRPKDGSLVQLAFEMDGEQLTVAVQTLVPRPAD
ncbi:MAG: hypothetical protein PHQ40_04880 [Anaerolineaceae bacterium]|nr:hypothetical protein [Anaerolineaceae bacterium]